MDRRPPITAGPQSYNCSFYICPVYRKRNFVEGMCCLKNSPKAFQSIAQEVLGDLLYNGALVYIDDIILFTKTIDEHFELLDDLQPDETEVKGIVPSPRYNLRARAGNSAH
ncbi:hypothetical protein TNCV_3950791 [Trichonephila clavipes]|nr:hypothetical protein TNCV_3950791 [Trichonephila clavipes]